MRKIMITSAGLLLSAFCIGVTSCNDDDDNVIPPGIDTNELTLGTEIDVDFDSDFLEICDVTVTYTDFTGATRTEAVTTTDWKKQLFSTTFPCTSDYSVSIARKPNVQLTRAYYDLEADVEYEAYSYLLGKRVTVLPDVKVTLCHNENVAAADVDRVIAETQLKADALQLSYRFNKSALNLIVPELVIK